MDRITEKDLQNLVQRINTATGNPQRYAHPTSGKAQIGHYHLDYAYGGVKLVQTMNDGGGIRNVSTGGYGTKRLLYRQLTAYLAGVEDCVRGEYVHNKEVKAITG